MEGLWIIVVSGYALCVVQSIFALTTKRPFLGGLSVIALVLAFGSHTLWLIIQGINTGRWPLVGTQETCAFLAWSLVVSYLVVHRWYRANALRAFIFPIVLVLATISAIAPTTPDHPDGISNPLQQVLFPVHAGLILLAYASFFMAFAAGLMYIIQERELRLKRFRTIFYRLPSLDTCDAISFKATAIGFVLLTLGIAAGIAWSRARDGVFLHGTPIEVFSFLTWGIYVLIIQSRMNAGWGGRTAAVASIVSFALIVCSLVGVRYLDDLHVF